ncbi:MAG: N-6 DNA methylase [Oceanospirillales bacterium]|nr:N-6 DNA methylase [Oceanospirillales bacterium]
MNKQLSLVDTPDLNNALLTWEASDSEKGEIFTKPEIVRFMITTMGLDGTLLNSDTQILEPSFGHGEFLIAITNNLISEIELNGFVPSADELSRKILAFELVKANVEETKIKIKNILSHYYKECDCSHIIESWLKCEDFLLSNIERKFSHIIGNPPYIRIENIPKIILSEYRNRYSTMVDRADIYIAFFERSLNLLKDEGLFSFICTDRWMKNQYGRNLRSLIDKYYNLDLYVDMYGKDSFQSKVMTYPAITLISKSSRDHTIVVHDSDINNSLAKRVKKSLISCTENSSDIKIQRSISRGNSPWIFGCEDSLSLIKKLESGFHLLEDTGCKVYIGAATGNNKVFVVDSDFDIEEDRKVPLITSNNIRNGRVIPSTKCIINTYDKNGVIDLNQYPKLKKYLESKKDILSNRHVAKLSPRNWFKTIDRVYPERAAKEKLLIPDIKSEFTLIYDNGVYHPNNSIYYICSDEWDLFALKAVLLSGIGKLFIDTYSTKVANGHLRFQAQHLRKIRIPMWQSIDTETKALLILAGKEESINDAKELIAKIYSLSQKEIEIIGK